jgi:hypothetical protein
LHNLPPVPAPAASVDEAPKTPVAASMAQVRGLFEGGDASAALAEAEKLISESGGLDVGRAAEEPELLQRVYEAVVGDLQAVPRFGKATPDLDSRSAFLLSRMDGQLSADDLLDVSGMRRLEALRVLALLVHSGVVTMKK